MVSRLLCGPVTSLDCHDSSGRAVPGRARDPRMTQGTLVTGATGFIGRHLVDRLLAANARVCVLTRPGRLLPERWHGRVDQVTCGEWREPALRESLHGYPLSTIFHLAAYGTHPRDRNVDQARATNTEAPVALVRLCSLHGARLVMAGTWSEYQAPPSR